MSVEVHAAPTEGEMPPRRDIADTSLTVRNLVALLAGAAAVASATAAVTVVVTKVASLEAKIAPIERLPKIEESVTELAKATSALLVWQSDETRQRTERAARAGLMSDLCRSGRLKGGECDGLPSRGAIDLVRP